MSTQSNVITKPIEQTEMKEPPKFRVMLHNDDKTTFDFVIFVLTEIFDKDFEEASEITMRVHEIGSATAGVYSHQIAESKIEEATMAAKANHFPLKLTAEEF